MEDTLIGFGLEMEPETIMSQQIIRPMTPTTEPTNLDQAFDPEIKTLNQAFGTVWFEKYRPTNFNEIVGQDEIIINILEHINNIPHMILEGDAGTGKTTIVNLISKELNAKMLVLNSSEDRGINTIRKDTKIPKSGRVIDFIKHADITGRPKIVFFDEADGMTTEAQDSLKAIIEKYSGAVRFIFACNNIDKIIKPIKSRCKIYHFKPIETKDILTRLKQIVGREKIIISDEKLKGIADKSEGDFRRAINELQTGV